MKRYWIIALFWVVIFAKCLWAEWAIQRYAMPFSSLFIWIPTLLFGLIATIVYEQKR